MLIAENEDRQSLYAVERVSLRVYALCKIGGWVQKSDLVRIAGRPCESIQYHQAAGQVKKGDQWWKNAAIVPPGPEHITTGPSSRKAPRLSMLYAGSYEQPNPSSEPTATPPTSKSAPVDVAPTEAIAAEEDDVSTVGDMQETLIVQYLDMLYKSKTSLAYFAKGPVTRFRNAAATCASTDQPDLPTFLRSLILSSSMSDKKYREVLPSSLKDLPLRGASDDDHAKAVTEKRRKKKNKKLRLDKKGLLPDELDYFIGWWKDDDDLGVTGESVEQCFRRRSLVLRTRETFLQIILTLEILAFESASVDANSHGTNVKGDSVVKPKSKKPQDLHLALDLLLDKLCIWHSLDGNVSADALEKKDGPDKPVPNQLRDFCFEVIVPFYTSRVPEQAMLVNKKLGGPSAPSAAKTKSKSHRSGDKEAGKKPRDPLSRVSSDTVNHSSRATASLTRSATDSQIVPNLKRESSEASLDLIPRKHSVPQLPKRSSSSALDKSRIRQREVDFDAMSQAQETKRKKQADVEEKLKDAISALKRPNREVVSSKAMSEAAEQRQLIAQARAKASQSQKKRVEINATPKRGRTQMITATPHERSRPLPAYSIAAPASGSSVSLIPSSSIRPLPALLTEIEEEDEEVPQTGHRPRHANVNEKDETTPSRGPDKFAVPSLPTVRPFALAPKAVAPQTPSKKQNTRPREADGRGDSGFEIRETPETKRIVDFVEATPVKSKLAEISERPSVEDYQTNHDPEDDIYSALGWE